MTLAPRPRTVAITGAGLGRDTALALAEKGYRVFGTARSTGEIEALHAASHGRVQLHVTDITDPDQVSAWACQVLSEADGGLDVLIHNASTLTVGPLELLPGQAIRDEFAVSAFAPVTNAFLPALRQQLGRIVFVSVWTASLPLPFNGPSGAAKAAMEALATAYRAELRRFGIDVTIAAPGSLRTMSAGNVAAMLQKISDGFSADQCRLYGDAFAAFARQLNDMQSTGMSAREAALELVEIVEESPAPLHTAMGEEADEILRLVKALPLWELDDLRLRMVGLTPDGEVAPTPGFEAAEGDTLDLVREVALGAARSVSR